MHNEVSCFKTKKGYGNIGKFRKEINGENDCKLNATVQSFGSCTGDREVKTTGKNDRFPCW